MDEKIWTTANSEEAAGRRQKLINAIPYRITSNGFYNFEVSAAILEKMSRKVKKSAYIHTHRFFSNMILTIQNDLKRREKLLFRAVKKTYNKKLSLGCIFCLISKVYKL